MLLLASASEETLSRGEHDVSSYAPVFCATDLGSVRGEVVRIKPHIFLLDYNLPILVGSDGISSLMKLNPETKVIFLTSLLPDEIEWSLFRTGIRGCCRRDIESGQLKCVVEAVQKGELWIRRELSRHLLN